MFQECIFGTGNRSLYTMSFYRLVRGKNDCIDILQTVAFFFKRIRSDISFQDI